MSDEEEVSSVSDDGSDVSTEMSPGLRRLLDAVIDKSDPDALQKLLAKRQEELDRCLGSVLMDEDLPVDEKVEHAVLLLKAGANPNSRTSAQEPLLCRSVIKKEFILMAILLKFKADVNATDKNGRTALHYAAQLGLRLITRVLLVAGANVNALDKKGCIPIFDALSEGEWETAEVLLPDSDVALMTKRKETALHMAIGHFDLPRPEGLYERLIEKGADLNEHTQFHSPILLSVMYADLDAAKALTKAGCDVDKVDDGTKILNEVAQIRLDQNEDPTMAEIAKVLVEAGADVDGAIDSERTPLMDAVVSCNCPMAREFLQANCDTEMMDEDSDMCHMIKRSVLLEGFMRCCESDMACATYILVDACCAEKDQQAQRLYFKYLQENKELLSSAGVQLERPPISLYRLCRVAVRSTLPKGRVFRKALDQLPLPRHVMDFIALETSQ